MFSGPGLGPATREVAPPATTRPASPTPTDRPPLVWLWFD